MTQHTGSRRAPRPRAGLAVTGVAVLACAALAACAAVAEELARAVAWGPDADMVRHLQRSAREFVADPVVITLPAFTVDRAAGVVVFNTGTLQSAWYDGFEPDDPYRPAYRAQVEIEALRELFTRAVPGETFWRDPLEQAQLVVVGMLRDIRETAEAAPLEAKLADRQAEFLRTRVRLDEAIRGFAAEQGLAVRGTTLMFSVRRFSVPVQTVPDDGLVRVLPLLVFRRHEALGTPPDDMPWRTVSNPAELIGRYQYLVRWPDGRRGAGHIEVRSESGIVLQPDPE
jgi:hypothetical protein